ncbi:MAG: type II toxin-antitoxin system YafQ family toxin [Verrucomicrobiota bacterium]|nr:type II toxin-antitoxin system YafQ family toxin [Verrucomicrobiota bacterium]MDQ6939030.1 type II toxin-antitoxin system YafQ family toxin [Verrucomicrobiota bacterium]
MRLSQTAQFKKDIKRQRRRGKEIDKIKVVIERLLTGKPLPPNYKDHPLTGNWIGRRDCHVESDWILIYRILANELRLERTGTHSDLFG